MKKSTHTPDSATSDQALEQGSGQMAKVQTGPVKIHPASDTHYFLGYRSALDNVIKTVGPASLFFDQWEFVPYENDCRIRCPKSDYYLDADAGALRLLKARPYRDENWQKWLVFLAGGNYVYIQSVANKGIITVTGPPATGILVVLEAVRPGTPREEQKFLIGPP